MVCTLDGTVNGNVGGEADTQSTTVSEQGKIRR